MANEPILGSSFICAVDQSGNPVRIVVDSSYSPPRLVTDLPDRALRDLGIVTVDGTVTATGISEPYTQAFAYSGTLVQYVGYAAPGTAKSAAGWAIKLFTYDGSNNVTDVQWAGGAATFANVWNDRAGLSYS